MNEPKPKLAADVEAWMEQVHHAAAALKTTLISQRRVVAWRVEEWNERLDQIVKEVDGCAEAIGERITLKVNRSV